MRVCAVLCKDAQMLADACSCVQMRADNSFVLSLSSQ
jgi:hypothetical protein